MALVYSTGAFYPSCKRHIRARSGFGAYFYLEYPARVRCNFTVKGIKNSKLKISVTDPLGYIIKTVTVAGNQRKSFTEMIDLKGFLIVESEAENYDEPYSINIREIP